MTPKFIKSKEKKAILSQLEEQFGITKLPYLLIEAGKEKVRAFSGHLSKEEITALSRLTHLEIIGIYLIRKENPIRLSFDAPHLLKDQIKKNIIEITDAQAQDWLKGHNLEIKKPRGSYIIKNNGDEIGLGKSNQEIILNHVPKDRRSR